MKKEYFTEKEIIETIKDNIDAYEGVPDYDFEDFFDDLFNSGEYFIGYKKAEEALKEYGIFKALGEVQDWDAENFGRCEIDYANPEAVANTLEYIHAYKAFDSILVNAHGTICVDSDLSTEHVTAFKEALKEVAKC